MNRTIEVVSVHKNGVLAVVQTLLSAMEKPHLANNDFNVCSVIEHSFGKQNTTVSHVPNTGSGCGLSKTARSDYYANCQLIVPPNCMASRIIGLDESPKSTLITLRSDI